MNCIKFLWYFFLDLENLFSYFSPLTSFSINLRPDGGHILPPSRIFAITWELCKISPPNFQYLIGHQFDTLSENVVKFGWKILRKWRFSDAMSCDFELKMVISYIDRRSMYAEANRKQKVSKQRKLNSLQYGYLGFSFFFILTPKISKNNFLGKCIKIQNFLTWPWFWFRF